MAKKLKVAVIGSGISGLSSAWLVANKHDVCLFEKNNYLGGHSNTQTITTSEKKIINVDTGFIVFNKLNYPNLTEFFKLLNVETYESNMSFSVSMRNREFEYGGNDLSSFFAQKKNFFSFTFWIMIVDILRFYKNAEKDVSRFSNLTIEEYLKKNFYSRYFKYDHLYPMAGSIWSSPLKKIKDFPFQNFVNFFKNHGLLSLTNRPQWRTVLNGSKNYVNKIIETSNIEVKLSERAINISRKNKEITLKTDKKEYKFDHIILASHPDQNINILSDITDFEYKYLSKIKYQKNTAWLHYDDSLMPKNKKVWSSWNYINANNDEEANNLSVTYWMNKLQKINTKDQIFVSLNPLREPSKNKVFKKIVYSHPLYSKETVMGQNGLVKIQGKKNTWFCGAYLGNGFHEDGIKSGLDIAERITGLKRPWKT